MPETEVLLYCDDDGSCPLLDWLDDLPQKAQDKCLVRIERLAQLGHELRRPEADTLRDGIHELRVSNRRQQHRILYFFHEGSAVLSHGITKESKVPDMAIERARSHRKDSKLPLTDTPIVLETTTEKGDSMTSRKKTADAVEILHRRYIGNDADRLAGLEQERLHAKVARQIYDLRTAAGLSQRELAKRVGTTQSAISRLEDADYEGHSVGMLRKVATALGARVDVGIDSCDAASTPGVFPTFLNLLRRSKGLTLDELAAKADIAREDLAALERSDGVRPSPRTVHQLSRFYGLSAPRLAALAGTIGTPIDEIREPALRFAAQSESFSKLTREERKALSELVTALREDAD